MTDRSYPIAVQRALDELPPVAQAAALAQLPYARGEEEQLNIVTDAWLRCAQGSDYVDTVRWIRSRRRRDRQDMRRAGTALDVMDDGDRKRWINGLGRRDNSLPFGRRMTMLVDQDPLASLLARERLDEYQDGLRAVGIMVDAAPATIDTLPALSVMEVVTRIHRGLRAVQTAMRRICCAELAGQGVLPGIPSAREVYRARALGNAA